MEKYADLNNDSGVSSYEIRDKAIEVWFNLDRVSYVYSYASAGEYHVERMKVIAMAGKGLNTYISNNVKRDYERE